VLQVFSVMSQSGRQHGYRNTRWVSWNVPWNREHKSNPPLDALFVAKTQRNPFISARELKCIIFR